MLDAETVKWLLGQGALGVGLIAAVTIIVALWRDRSAREKLRDEERDAWQLRFEVLQERRLVEAREALNALNNSTAALNLLSTTSSESSATRAELTEIIKQATREAELGRESMRSTVERLEVVVKENSERISRLSERAYAGQGGGR